MSAVKQLENTTFYCGPDGTGGSSYSILLQSYNTYPKNNSYLHNNLVWFGMKQGDSIINVYDYLKNSGYTITNEEKKRIYLDVEGGDSKCYCFLYNSATGPGGDEQELGIEPNVYITASDVDREIKFKWKGQFVFKFIQYGKTYIYCGLVNITESMINKSIYLIHDCPSNLTINSKLIPALNYSYTCTKIFYYSNKNISLTTDQELKLVSGTDILSALSTRNFEKIPTYIGEYDSNTDSVKRVSFNANTMFRLQFFTNSSNSWTEQAYLDISNMSKYYIVE